MARCEICGQLFVVRSLLDQHNCDWHDIDCGDDE